MDASALRELEPGPRAALSVLLPLLHPRVAGEEAFLLELLAKLQVVLGESAGDSVPDRAGLARRAAAGDRHVDVELLGRLARRERLLDDHLQNVVGEVLVERALVDGDGAGAGHEPDASHRCLAPSRGRVLDFDCQGSSEVLYLCRPPQAAETFSGRGCCASWGCLGPR